MKFKEEMTALERQNLYWTGESVDRIPYSMDLGESAVPIFGFSNRDYLFSASTMATVEGLVLKEFGGDGVGVSINTRAFGEAFGSTLKYTEYGYSYIEKFRLEKQESILNLEKINPYRSGRIPIILEAAKILKERYGEEYPFNVGVPCPANCALGLCSMENLLVAMLRNPDRFNYIMEYCLENLLDCVQVFYKETGASFTIFESLASSQIISKLQFEKNIYTYVERLANGIKQITGAVPAFGGSGKNNQIWDDLIEIGIQSIGLDALDDIKEAKEKIGMKAAIWGNVDPLIFIYGTSDEIRSNVYRCLIDASDNPRGYTLGIGGGTIPFGASIENIKVYSRFAKEYGRGAQMGHLCKGLENNEI